MELHERLRAPGAPEQTATDPFAAIKNRIHQYVITELGPQLYQQDMDQTALRSRVLAVIRAELATEQGLSREDRERLAEAISDDTLGHGPLEKLLLDPTVTEVMVNGPGEVWIERDGRLELTSLRFTDDSHLRRIINKIVALVGRRIDEASPMVDARLPDGSRVNAIIPPLSLSGPLEPFLRDDTVSEIMVNGPHSIWVERRGKLLRTDAGFVDDQHLLRIIDKIISRIGRRIDESTPMVDARLPDGSRVNAIIPPLAVTGPTLTIRKFRRDPLTMEDLLRFGTLSPRAAQLLEACVRGKLNILISGGTGSGKTTTLNVLSAAIPEGERIITIEDAAELQLRQEHVITLESRPANIEGKGLVNIRDLVRNCLRMRPDRIIVGECRGAETIDMLQAMNTGHDGSLTTIHANTPRDALSRVETLVLTGGVELPLKAIREQIASAFDMVVQVSRLVDGTRRITHVTEVLRMESDVVTLQDLFIAKPLEDGEEVAAGSVNRLLGPMKASGIKPQFLSKLGENGVHLPPQFFQLEPDRAGATPTRPTAFGRTSS
jgi:pilus assembly protein CpaF